MSAVDLAASVRTGQRSARSVVEEYLEAIDAAEDRIHAFNLVMEIGRASCGERG